MSEVEVPAGKRRDVALFRTLTTSAGLQIATVTGTIISLPFVTRSLSSAEYGVVVTLTGFLALLSFADFGAGAALTHNLGLSRRSGRDDPTLARKHVAAAMVSLGTAGLLVLMLGCISSLALPWQRILGAGAIPERTLTVCALCASCSVAVSIFGSLGQRALFGLQRGATANRWLIAGSLFAAMGSIVAATLSAPVYVFVITAIGIPALTSLACSAWVVLTTKTPILLPGRERPARGDLLSFWGASGWFLLIGISSAVSFQTDTLIVATMLGSVSAGRYSVALRIFGLVSQCLYPMFLQTWPAFAEAMSAGDSKWIRTRFKWALVIAFVFSATACGLLVMLADDIISIWLTDDLTSPGMLLVAMAIWTTYSITVTPVFFLMNGLGRVRTHALLALGAAVANLPLSLLLTHKLGIAGPVIGSFVSSALIQGIPGAFLTRRLLIDLPTEGVRHPVAS